jgi:hypothetical protein
LLKFNNSKLKFSKWDSEDISININNLKIIMPISLSRGRPSNNKAKSGRLLSDFKIEEKSLKQRKCSYCKKPGHNVHKCLDRDIEEANNVHYSKIFKLNE